MKIAIIGGGAAGMTLAYLLRETHAVTVLEKQPILGGNIRTLNKNVTGVDLAPNLVIDNGVIEFLKDHNPRFSSLMADLGVALEYVQDVSTQLFFESGRVMQTPGAFRKKDDSLVGQLRGYLALLPLAKDFLLLHRQLRPANYPAFKDQPVSAFFGDGVACRWLKMLLMYSYSIPYTQIDRLPVEFAAFSVHNAGIGTRWNRIAGGVYTYIEKILARFSGEAQCNVDIASITRSAAGVAITLRNGETQHYDRVVFATPPDQVLKLLADPTDSERRRFRAWKGNQATTLIHTDTRLYQPYETDIYTEFDVFEKDGGRDAGYNAYLNRLCGVPKNHAAAYYLAYNLTERINSDKIIHAQQHHTPLYTVEAFKYREEIKKANGENHTYHAGAYLDNGLHEGAIVSAVAASRLLGGKVI